MTKKLKSIDGHESKTIFARRFEILLYAVRATDPVTTNIVLEDVVEADRQVIRDCLNDLVEYGLLAKISTTKYVATDFAKELMGVNT